MVLFQKHVVGVQPHAVIHGRVGEGLVSGGGEVVPPGEVEDQIGKPGGNVLCAVRGAGVHDHDFIHQMGYAVQAPAQHVLLVFHNHAQTDARHRGSLLWIQCDCTPAGSHRWEYIVLTLQVCVYSTSKSNSFSTSCSGMFVESDPSSWMMAREAPTPPPTRMAAPASVSGYI